MFSKIIPIIALVLIVVIFLIYPYHPNQTVACSNCNVILISIDVLRNDHLGIYGYSKNTSPNIDKFFQDGFVFENAFSQSPLTRPSEISILTGVYPSHHKMMDDNSPPLSTDYKTIAEVLKQNGYKTFAMYEESPSINSSLGVGRGIDNFAEGDFVTNYSEVSSFIQANKNQKFFIDMYTVDLHDPYVAEPPYDTMFDKNYNGSIIGNADQFYSLAYQKNITNNFDQRRLLYWSFVNKSDPRDIRHLIALYDSNVYRVDSSLGRIFNYLNSQGLLNNTIVIFTSDHGEEFGEHGGFLHEKMYDETIHVPLLIYVPNSKHTEITDQVSGIDVMPTLLSILGIQQSQNIDGKDLKFLMENPKAPDPNQTMVSEYTWERAMRTPDWKLIKTENGTISYQFFDLKNDMKEKINLDGLNIDAENKSIQMLQNWEVEMNSVYINVKFLNSTFLGYP